jgi:adenine-specific DNA methylase
MSYISNITNTSSHLLPDVVPFDLAQGARRLLYAKKQRYIMNGLFEDFFNHKFPQPQYLGAKTKHLSWIGSHIPKNIKVVLDAFAGSQSVAFYMKQKGFKVLTNDFLNCNNQIGKSLIENNDTRLSEEDLKLLFQNNLNPSEFNLIEKIFKNIFFEESECRVLDSFRSNVELLPSLKKALALSIMNRSLTRKVTMGHFGHTKALEYANNEERVRRNRNLARPIKDIFLDLVKDYNNAVFDNRQDNKSFNEDAITLISNLDEKIDLLYLDPPYCGSHPDYQGFYHLLETFTEYWKDKKFINGIKHYFPKKISGFDTKKDILESFDKLLAVSNKIPYWLISYNDRSYPSQETMIEIISKYRNVALDSKKYHNGVGGKGSVRGSCELLFICSPR